ANELERLLVLAGHDGDRGIALDRRMQIPELAVDADGERGRGETGSDRGRDLGPGNLAVELLDAAVWQCDGDHADQPWRVAARSEARALGLAGSADLGYAREM